MIVLDHPSLSPNISYDSLFLPYERDKQPMHLQCISNSQVQALPTHALQDTVSPHYKVLLLSFQLTGIFAGNKT